MGWKNFHLVSLEGSELLGVDELNAGWQTVGERNDLGTCREGLTNWHLDKTELRSSRDGGGSWDLDNRRRSSESEDRSRSRSRDLNSRSRSRDSHDRRKHRSRYRSGSRDLNDRREHRSGQANNRSYHRSRGFDNRSNSNHRSNIREAVLVFVEALVFKILRSLLFSGQSGSDWGVDRNVTAWELEAQRATWNVLEDFPQAVSVDEAVFSGYAARLFLGFGAERTVFSFEAKGVGAVLVQLVDFFEDFDDGLLAGLFIFCGRGGNSQGGQENNLIKWTSLVKKKHNHWRSMRHLPCRTSCWWCVEVIESTDFSGGHWPLFILHQSFEISVKVVTQLQMQMTCMWGDLLKWIALESRHSLYCTIMDSRRQRIWRSQLFVNQSSII